MLATGVRWTAQLTKLRAAYSAESSWSLATWIALDGGLYKKYGLDVDLVLIRSASTITSALIAGEAPMIQLGGNGTIQAALAGRGHGQRPDPGADHPAKFGGDAGYQNRRRSARQAAGSQPLRRVERSGHSPLSAQARPRSGEGCHHRANRRHSGASDGDEGGRYFRRVDFAAGADGGEKGRLQRTVRFRNPRLQVSGGDDRLDEKFHPAQPPTALNFVRGEIEGIHAIRTQKNLAINVLKKYMRINDPDILEDGYRYAVKFFQARPYPTLDEVRAVLEEYKSMPQAANAKPEQFIDLSLLQELEKEKFFDRFK